MIEDVRTVVWKEWKALFRQPGGRLRLLLSVAVPIGYFGVVGPLQAGSEFVSGADPWFVATIVPLLTVIVTSPDSFAGERERKTLRTLLASRLPDSAILWAKISFAVFLAMGLTISTMLLALVVTNLFTDTNGLAMFEFDELIYLLAVSFLISVLASGVAVLISLRAETVQQAQMTLTAAFFLLPTVLGPIVLIVFRDSETRPIQEFFTRLGTTTGRVWVLVALAAAAVAAQTLARINFTRSKLTS